MRLPTATPCATTSVAEPAGRPGAMHDWIMVRLVGWRPVVTGRSSHFRGYRTEAGGCFASWQWNGRDLVAESRPYGLVPLFYALLPDGIAVSPSVHTLLELGIERTLDLPAIATFLRLGFYVGDDTPFAAIRSLPRTGAIVWNDRGCTASSESCVERAELRRTDAIGRYAQLFTSAMRRCVPEGSHVLPLSGGRDSRHILYELLMQGHTPKAVSTEHFPPRANEDASVAVEVCRVLGIAHEVLPQPKRLMPAEREKNRLTHFMADEHAFLLPLRHYLERNEIPAFFDGFGGDVLTAPLFLRPPTMEHLRARRFGEAAQDITAEWEDSEEAIRLSLSRAAYKALDRELAIDHVRHELQTLADWHNPLTAFYFFNRTRREISLAPFGVLSNAVAVCPFLDAELLDFFLSLPAEMISDCTLHDETIRMTYPQWAHLPFERKLPPVHDDRWRTTCLDLVSSLSTASWLDATWLLPRLLREVAILNPGASRWIPWMRMACLAQLFRQYDVTPVERPPADYVPAPGNNL